MLTLKAQLLTSSADMKVSLDQGRDAQVKLNWQLNSATVQRLCYKQTASKSGTVNLKPLIYFRTESKKFYKRGKKKKKGVECLTLQTRICKITIRMPQSHSFTQ